MVEKRRIIISLKVEFKILNLFTGHIGVGGEKLS